MAIKPIPYSREELRAPGPPRSYRGDALREIAYPLGGIGTGCVSLAGNGSLRDWEIFGRPAKGQRLPGSFCAVWVKPQGRPPQARVLKGPGLLSYMENGASGDRSTGGGLAHFRDCTFTGRLPFAGVEFHEPGFPVQASLEAFSPFIPLNDRDSSIPVAILLYRFTNATRAAVRLTLNANLANGVGTPELGQNVNEFAAERGLRGLRMSTRKHQPHSPRFGTMALATPWRHVSYLAAWPADMGLVGLNRFWSLFREAGRFGNVADTSPSVDGHTHIGALALHATLAPGESATMPVIIAWHFPNYQKQADWGDTPDKEQPVWRQYYASLWDDAWDVARYVARHLPRLERESREFQEALFSSTLPEAALDAVASQATILRTPTCLRLSDGTFWGFEGCNDRSGCCPGTCTHVWNYAQTLAYLFPQLERSSREAEYRYDLAEDGHMTFRMPLPLGTPGGRSFHAAADGQHGGILRAYREWLISGDDDFLRRVWPAMKQAMAYTWRHWDPDRDGVMEGVQHNTYDIEFWGPNSMLGSYYLAALRAMEQIAVFFGEREPAVEYRRVYDSGRAWLDAQLFNGEYYEQQVNPHAPRDPLGPGGGPADEEPPYQYGPGCLADQVIGQWYAAMLGLGYILDPAHVKQTLRAIFRYNWVTDLHAHDNPQRIYAADGEKGLLLCTWPRGGRPQHPFFYSDEVWTGIEYQVASHLIYEGLVDEGLAVVRGVRERHDGRLRNPWNEFECGHHYARALASWALLLALSGFRYWAPEAAIGFEPRVHADDFACFWCVGSGWGDYRQRLGEKRMRAEIRPRVGELILRRLELPQVLRGAKRVAVQLNGAPLEAAFSDRGIELARPAKVRAGGLLEVLASH